MSHIICYTNNSDRKALKKDLVKQYEVNGRAFQFKEPFDILEPVVDLSMDKIEAQGGDWTSINYIYLPKFKRYYFAEAQTVANRIIRYKLSVDPLQTYQTQLLGSSFMIARSKDKNSQWYIDSERPIQSNHILDTKNYKWGSIPDVVGDNRRNYYVTVSGGAAST